MKTKHRETKHWPLVLSIIGACLLATTSARAGLAESFGGGSHPQSMSGAGSATIDDWAAAFYNPAGVASPSGRYTSKNPSAGAATATEPFAYHQSFYDREEHPHMMGISVGVPISDMYIRNYQSNELADKNAAIASDLPSFSIMNSGMVFDVRPVLHVPVPTKLGVNIQQFGSLELAKVTEQSPQAYDFRNIGRNSSVLGLISVLAFELWPHRLSIGVGMNHSAQVSGTVEVTETDSDTPVAESNLHIKLAPKFVGGLQYKQPLSLNQRLHFGFTYRGENSVKADVDINAEIPVAGLGVVAQAQASLLLFFTPEAFIFGMAYELYGFQVVGDVELQRWSKFELSNTRQYLNENPDFHDIVILRGGLRLPIPLELTKKFKPLLRLGYAYVPAYTPDQSGLSNYLDNDKHIFSAGLGLFMPPDMFVLVDTILDISFQWQLWQPRKSIKTNRATLTDGSDQPDYEFGGNFYVVTVTATNPF